MSIMNLRPTVVVFSNNGVIGHCSRFKFILAVLLNFFRGYKGLRFCGSYPLKC